MTATPDEPLLSALVEFCTRILTDAAALPPASRDSLKCEICARSFDGDSPGQIDAAFRKSVNQQSSDIGAYTLRTDHFTCLQEEDEDDIEFERRHLEWLLDHYALVKEALRSPEVWPLYERLNQARHLPVDAGTSNGFFDLQADKDDFGELPEDDLRLQLGAEPLEDDPLVSLTAGVLDLKPVGVVEELVAALIQYTPPHFSTIQCTITEDTEKGKRALFYDIQCPDFPDDSTTEVNDRVHRAATQLVQQATKERGSCARLCIVISMQPDGTWRHVLEFS